MRGLVVLWLLFMVLTSSAQSPDSTIDEGQRRQRYFDAKGQDGLDVEAANVFTKQMLHGVQLGLERYAVNNPDGWSYPDSIDQLVQKGYLPSGLYPNAVSGMNAADNSAMDVPFGWSSLAPGNFTYLKRYDDEGRVDLYLLVGYGAVREGTGDMDGDGVPDGVIIGLGSALRINGEVADHWLTGVQPFWTHGQKLQLNVNYQQ
ncbi:MAG: hypothetical protein WC553_02320 [Patescibacteria group bacterium]